MEYTNEVCTGECEVKMCPRKYPCGTVGTDEEHEHQEAELELLETRGSFEKMPKYSRQASR
jgi:hypothetical protein